MMRTSKLRTALSVAGIVLSVVVGYNTWAQIEQVNAAGPTPPSNGEPADGSA
ncbi:hypothetical protein [Subtercola sp. YIM 133946]|uniref:hypothetical protein n=1 Tax=Subtercola sp. YIM 133946 TaxID=3118909 RepID=UPI002F95F572